MKLPALLKLPLRYDPHPSFASIENAAGEYIAFDVPGTALEHDPDALDGGDVRGYICEAVNQHEGLKIEVSRLRGLLGMGAEAEAAPVAVAAEPAVVVEPEPHLTPAVEPEPAVVVEAPTDYVAPSNKHTETCEGDAMLLDPSCPECRVIGAAYPDAAFAPDAAPDVALVTPDLDHEA